MLRFFKIISLVATILIIATPAIATDPIAAPNAIPTSSPQIIMEREHASLSRQESRVRNAAVKVSAPDGSEYGSGTYSVISGKHVVLTASHVVRDNPFMVVIGRSGEIVFGNVAYIDGNNDFAVLVVPELESRTAIPFRPSKKSLEDLIGEKVHYTGFPNHHDLFSVRAYVAGIQRDGRTMLLLNGYAWMGASGSGVFGSTGNFIGTLVAVDVGTWRDPQILETVVWITPVANLDIKSIEEHIKYYKAEIPEYHDP